MSLISQIETAAKTENEIKIISERGVFTGKIYDFTPKTLVLKELSGAYKNIDIAGILSLQDLNNIPAPVEEDKIIACRGSYENYFIDIDSLNGDLNKEIREIKSRKIRKTIVVERYELKKQSGVDYYYDIYVSEDFKIQEEMNVRLYTKAHELIAVVVSAVHDLKLTIQTQEKLIGDLYRIDTSFDPGFILKSMSNAFDFIKSNTNGIFRKIINKELNEIKFIESVENFEFNSRLNPAQQSAVELACSCEISFIWGPPGTGKTHTLAELLYQKFLNGQKCLVLSTANAAVDQIIKGFHKLASGVDTSKVIRLGHTDDEICLNYVRSRAQSLNPQIVFSTLAACSLKYGYLLDYKFDTVIVDETSMASMAHVLIAANLAGRNIVFAGDEKQLSPISISGSKSLFINIYDYIPDYKKSRFVKMLNVQYRMNEKISDFISDTFYDGMLECGTGIDHEQPYFINIDNSKYDAAYFSVDEQSYYNPIGLFLSDVIIKKYSSHQNNSKILLISPFRAQQILFSKYIIDSGVKNANALTIHKSQGSEADIVIVDITAYETDQAFYNSRETANLLNVAFSRTKKQLFIIGSLEMVRKLSMKNNFWASLNYQLQDKFKFYNYDQLLNQMEAFTFDLFEKNAGKTFLITDNGNNRDFFEYIASSGADKKYYISANYCGDEKLLKNRVILRTQNTNKFPFMVVYNDVIIIYLDGRYKMLSLINASGSIKRIAAAHLVDIEEDGARHTHSLLCPKCESNMVLEGSFSYFHLKCTACGVTHKINEKIANDIKRIYSVKCPECFSEVKPMKKPSDRTYTFFGCMNYPRCRGTVNFSSLRG